MRIVDVCAFYAPQGGGVKTYVEQKLAYGPTRGHEIVIVAPGDEDRTETRPGGGRIEWVKSPHLPVDRRYRYFDDEARLLARVEAQKPDLIEASSPWRSASQVGRAFPGVPRALFMHADPFAAYGYRWLGEFASIETIDRGLEFGWRYMRGLAAGYDVVVSPSEGLGDRLKAQGIGNVVTVPLGVEPGIFSPKLRDRALRGRMLAHCDLPEDATLLLGVGRFSPEKRWPMVVDAVTAAGLQRSIGLVLVGDGPQRRRVRRQARGNPHIFLAAPMRDRSALAKLMASADALIHGCDAETFSLVAAEAVASGLPLIVPDRGGTADHAAKSGGLVYESGSAQDATRAIVSFVDGPRPMPFGSARTMPEHFDSLFALYARTAAAARRAA
ncbi:MAG: glycosyltransferase [Alphaproteobacteria bacterium]|nr:glycosyltransferase [Alphaproteobacteria bacterium]